MSTASRRSKRLPPPQHAAEYVSELHPAAGPWREEEPKGFAPGLYLVELQRPNGSEMMVVKVYNASELDRGDLIRYAEVFPA